MFLVHSQRLCGTIERFEGPHHAQRKRAAAMPQPLLLEGLSLMCADPVFRVGTPAPKIVRSSYRHLSRDRQGEKRCATPNVPVFPDTPRRSRRADCAEPDPIATLSRFDAPDKERTPDRSIVSADGVSRRPRIARTRGGADPSAEPAASWSSRFGPWRCQFIPISTAIRIRSEWFLAPSFCLSRDVVLATVL